MIANYRETKFYDFRYKETKDWSSGKQYGPTSIYENCILCGSDVVDENGEKIYGSGTIKIRPAFGIAIGGRRGVSDITKPFQVSLCKCCNDWKYSATHREKLEARIFVQLQRRMLGQPMKLYKPCKPRY